MSEPKPTKEDYAAAREVIARSALPEGHGDKEAALLDFLAERHARLGRSAFRLVHGLREPRDRVEELQVQLWRDEISKEEYRAQMAAEAARPVDAEMLRRFFEDMEKTIEHYGAMRRTIVEIAYDQLDPDVWIRRESEVDRHAAAMCGRLDILPEHIDKVLSFLEEARVIRERGHVEAPTTRAATAAMLVFQVVDQVSDFWKSCRRIAERSRTDPRYMYATTASKLFLKPCDRFPLPNELQALMQEEHALARVVLRELAPAPTPDGAPQVQRCEGKEHAGKPFPTPAGAKWEDVRIRFVDGHTVSIKVQSVAKTCGYVEMGIVDRRNAQPTKQWELLRSLAEGHGVLTWTSRDADRKNQKRREQLARNLREFFRIEGEPIVLTDDRQGWKTAFVLEPDG